jgi:hypothetical protein
VTLALVAFGVVDLARWSRDHASARRSGAAVVSSVMAVIIVAALSGLGAFSILIAAVGAACATGVWVGLARRTQDGAERPRCALAWLAVVLLACCAASGVPDPIGGPLRDWYANLAFPQAEAIGVDQFLLGGAAALFLLASANQVVVLVLDAAGTPVKRAESALKGGRLLGPLERLLVYALLLAGELTGASVVIAAKALLRLPEIRTRSEQQEGTDDQITEYVLIGTLSSLLIAGGLAGLVLAAG